MHTFLPRGPERGGPRPPREGRPKGLKTQAASQLLCGFKRRFTLSGLLTESRVHHGPSLPPSLCGEMATTMINGASKNSKRVR